MDNPFGYNFDPDRSPEEIAHLLELAIKALGEIIVVDGRGRIVYMSDEYESLVFEAVAL